MQIINKSKIKSYYRGYPFEHKEGQAQRIAGRNKFRYQTCKVLEIKVSHLVIENYQKNAYANANYNHV